MNLTKILFNFDFHSAALKTGAYAGINRVASVLNRYP